MKIKCNACGKKEAEFMSKAEIKMKSHGFASPGIYEKVLNIVEDLFSPKYIVCTACGHCEKAE